MNRYKSGYFVFVFIFFAFNLNAQKLPIQPDYLQYSIKLYKPILNYEKAKPDFIVNASARAFALYTATKDKKYLTDCKNNMTFIFEQWAADPGTMSKYSIFFNLFSKDQLTDYLNRYEIKIRMKSSEVHFVSIIYSLILYT